MIITNYSFDASAKTITFNDREAVEVDRLALITNLTDGIVIYQFQKPGKRISSSSGNVVTLEYDTTSMDDNDEIRIDYSDINDSGSDIGQINEFNSSISVVSKSVVYGPYTLTLIDDVTDVIDLGRFAEANVRISLTSPDFVQFDYSYNGYDGWSAKGTSGSSTTKILPKYARFFRVHRITTSANPITIWITANSVATPLGTSTTGQAVTDNPVTIGMSGLNTNSTYVRSARALNDQISGDEILGTAQHGYVGTLLYDKIRVANIQKNANTSTSGDATVWTPASGKKFRLMKYMIEVTSNSSLASAGILTITLKDGSTSMPIVHKVYLDVNGYSEGNVLQTGLIDLGNGYISTTANNALIVNLSSAITPGVLNITAIGMEE